MSWIYIDDLNITNEVNQIHCDTRDFGCTTDTELKDLFPNYKENHVIEANKIKEFLKSLETMSGGKTDWRMISFNNVEDANWLKYIRMYRIPNTNKFIVCNRNNVPIEYQNCTDANLRYTNNYYVLLMKMFKEFSN